MYVAEVMLSVINSVGCATLNQLIWLPMVNGDTPFHTISLLFAINPTTYNTSGYTAIRKC